VDEVGVERAEGEELDDSAGEGERVWNHGASVELIFKRKGRRLGYRACLWVGSCRDLVGGFLNGLQLDFNDLPEGISAVGRPDDRLVFSRSGHLTEVAA
jgi:hypothetical protein